MAGTPARFSTTTQAHRFNGRYHLSGVGTGGQAGNIDAHGHDLSLCILPLAFAPSHNPGRWNREDRPMQFLVVAPDGTDDPNVTGDTNVAGDVWRTVEATPFRCAV